MSRFCSLIPTAVIWTVREAGRYRKMLLSFYHYDILTSTCCGGVCMQYPIRKTIRLPGYDYNTPGWYFITICTKGKEKLLCEIQTKSIMDGAKPIYSNYGSIACKQLDNMAHLYQGISLDKYVVMPNHIHLLLHVDESSCGKLTSRQNTPISKFVGTFKRFCNSQYGHNIWQARSYDHIIRDEKDYLKIWNYIDCNPGKWTEDCFYME